MSARDCVVCGSNTAEPFYQQKQEPVHIGVLWKTREEALDAPRGDLELAFCQQCGHVFNVSFTPSLLGYHTEEYDNCLNYSPRFQQYETWQVQRLIDQYNLRHKQLVEIGSGKGDFLKLLSEKGGSSGYGFDPSGIQGTVDLPSSTQVHFLREYFSPQNAPSPIDFVFSRHTLEHIPDPVSFLKSIHNSLQPKFPTILFFEVPNFHYTIRENAVWDLIYEHCSYFSRCSIVTLFHKAGFQVLQTEETFGGQFLTIDASFSGSFDEDLAPYNPEDLEEMRTLLEKFTKSQKQKKEFWDALLDGYSRNNTKAVIWGTGAKGVCFLNSLDTDEVIEFAVDINPNKANKFVPGTGQRIVPPSKLQEYRPNVVILMNPIYRDEVMETLRSLSLDVELLVA